MKRKLTAILLAGGISLAGSIAHSEKKKQEKADQTVTISGNDMMKFDKTGFEVKAGTKVKLVFKNVGKIPKIAMGHNVVILKKGITAIAFGQKALAAGANAVNALPDSVKGVSKTKVRMRVFFSKVVSRFFSSYCMSQGSTKVI